MKNYIYFDNNATSALLPEVKNAMLDFLDFPINASATHAVGRKGRQIIESSRASLRKLLDIDQQRYNVIFTSSATEANNLALRGLQCPIKVTSTIEHASVLNNTADAVISVNSDGLVDLELMEHVVSNIAAKNSNDKFLVSVMFANNETGVLQPISEIARIVHKYSGIFHTDAVQAIGRLPFSVSEMKLDLVTVAAHKIGGPCGVGALICKKDIELSPIIIGGGQEYRLRAGTYNIPAILGFGAICDFIIENGFESKTKALRDKLESKISEICSNAIIFGKNAKRLDNTSMFTMPDIDAVTQIMHFDARNIIVSAGAACSSGRVDLPRVLMAMGYPLEIAKTAIRVSLGRSNTEDEVEQFAREWANLYQFTRKIQKKGENV